MAHIPGPNEANGKVNNETNKQHVIIQSYY